MISTREFSEALNLNPLFTQCQSFKQNLSQAKKTPTKDLIENLITEWEQLRDCQVSLSELRERFSLFETTCANIRQKPYSTETSRALFTEFEAQFTSPVQNILLEIEEMNRKFEIKIVKKKNIEILNVVSVPSCGKEAILKFLSLPEMMHLNKFLVRQCKKSWETNNASLRKELAELCRSKNAKIARLVKNKSKLSENDLEARELLKQAIALLRVKVAKIQKRFWRKHNLPTPAMGKKGWVYDDFGKPQTMPFWLYDCVKDMNEAEWQNLLTKTNNQANDLKNIRKDPANIILKFGTELEAILEARTNKQALEDYGSDKIGTGGLRSMTGQFALHGLDTYIHSAYGTEEVSPEEREQLEYLNELIGLYFAFFVAEFTLKKAKTMLESSSSTDQPALGTPRGIFNNSSFALTPRSLSSPRPEPAGMTPRKIDKITVQIEALLDKSYTPRNVTLKDALEDETSILLHIQNFLLFMEGCEKKITALSEKTEKTKSAPLRKLEQELQSLCALSRMQSATIRNLLEGILKKNAHLKQEFSSLVPPS